MQWRRLPWSSMYVIAMGGVAASPAVEGPAQIALGTALGNSLYIGLLIACGIAAIIAQHRAEEASRKEQEERDQAAINRHKEALAQNDTQYRELRSIADRQGTLITALLKQAGKEPAPGWARIEAQATQEALLQMPPGGLFAIGHVSPPADSQNELPERNRPTESEADGQ